VRRGWRAVQRCGRQTRCAWPRTLTVAVPAALAAASHLQVFHPTAKMLVELSKSQDVEAGDGTTSVVVLCGALLDACSRLLNKGIHATVISESFQLAAMKAEEVLTSVAIPVRWPAGDAPSDGGVATLVVAVTLTRVVRFARQLWRATAIASLHLLPSVPLSVRGSLWSRRSIYVAAVLSWLTTRSRDCCWSQVDLSEREQLINAATTSLSSKVVSQDSALLAPIAVDAVLAVADRERYNVDLRDIRVVKAVGGTIDDTEVINGLVFCKRASHTGAYGGVRPAVVRRAGCVLVRVIVIVIVVVIVVIVVIVVVIVVVVVVAGAAAFVGDDGGWEW
jgi:hypothetical protein